EGEEGERREEGEPAALRSRDRRLGLAPQPAEARDERDRGERGRQESREERVLLPAPLRPEAARVEVARRRGGQAREARPELADLELPAFVALPRANRGRTPSRAAGEPRQRWRRARGRAPGSSARAASPGG